MPKTRKSTNLNRGYITRSLLRKKYEGHCGRRKENYREDTRDNSSSETLTSWHTQHQSCAGTVQEVKWHLIHVHNDEYAQCGDEELKKLMKKVHQFTAREAEG